VKYAFIEAQRTHHTVRRMCRLLEVSAAGYYEWRDRPKSARARIDETLTEAIVRVHAKSRQTYGRPRIHAELRCEGTRVSPKRVRRLMKSAGITGVRPRPFRRTTDSKHTFPIAENVVARNFDIKAIAKKNRIWAGDITYVPTREGWLYLAVVLDLVSRRVIGWSMSSTIDTGLVVDAMRAAIVSRKPLAGTVFHSDRGSQYASNDFRDLLKQAGFVQSMSRKGNCWDNSVSESFFGSLKGDLGDPVYESRAAARAKIFEYIEVWYNRERRHSTLGYLSPEDYESQLPIAA
jgi:putative transposase